MIKYNCGMVYTSVTGVITGMQDGIIADMKKKQLNFKVNMINDIMYGSHRGWAGGSQFQLVSYPIYVNLQYDKDGTYK